MKLHIKTHYIQGLMIIDLSTFRPNAGLPTQSSNSYFIPEKKNIFYMGIRIAKTQNLFLLYFFFFA